MNLCKNCGRRLGMLDLRDFCSQNCHDEYYAEPDHEQEEEDEDC